MPEEKHGRKGGKRDEKEVEGLQEKWRRDPVSGLFFGLILVMVGIVFFLSTQGWISRDDWWKYFIIGLGVIFLKGLL